MGRAYLALCAAAVLLVSHRSDESNRESRRAYSDVAAGNELARLRAVHDLHRAGLKPHDISECLSIHPQAVRTMLASEGNQWPT